MSDGSEEGIDLQIPRDSTEARLVVSRRIDYGVAERLIDLATQIPAETKRLRVDLARAGFLDSVALGILLRLRSGLERREPRVEISLEGLAPEVLRRFRTARFDRLFELVPRSPSV